MASNALGTLFKITTWGESHGKAVGVVIDGCPAGLALSEADIRRALRKRATGRYAYTSLRQESDEAEILSGVFEGKTTGAPISILISNKGGKAEHYEGRQHLLRPGHANFTYLSKFGLFDYRGGGRASARETVCRVAAGAVAALFLQTQGIDIVCYVKQIGSVCADETALVFTQPYQFCPDRGAEERMCALLEETEARKDSVGGIVSFVVPKLPAGLGDPVYEKLEANLAKALLSIPAAKGFEIGSGFAAAAFRGSEHNDPFIVQNESIGMATNHAGGVLGGISTGMPLVGSVAFKPTPSLRQAQKTLTVQGEEALLTWPEGACHDTCVALRAVSVVEAMVALVLADAVLLNRCARL